MPSHGRKPPDPRRVKPKARNRRVPPAPKSQRAGANAEACCPMIAALRSVKRGQFRLARRYAAMSVRLMAARLA